MSRVAVLFASCALACGPTSDHPLGGPYGGGSGDPTSPSTGSPYGTGSGGGGSSSGAPDAGTSPADSGPAGPPSSPPDAGDDASSPASTAPPTWTELHARYFAAGTIGNCPSCHMEMSTAPRAYDWLQGKGELVSLDDPDTSVLSWLGGGMPQHGPKSEPQATADVKAWAAAGRLDD